MTDTTDGAQGLQSSFEVDENYEFSAPKCFDFKNGESEDEIKKAELWFETAPSYAPSPFIPRVKAGRTFGRGSLCNFSHTMNEPESHQETASGPTEEVISANPDAGSLSVPTPDDKETILDENRIVGLVSEANYRKDAGELCTPKAGMISPKGAKVPKSSTNTTAKKMANSSVSRLTNQTRLPGERCVKTAAHISAKKNMGSADFALVNQAIKRQKLEGGKSRQILDIKNRIFPHKSKPGSATGGDISECIIKGSKVEKNGTPRRKVYVKEPVVPFVSMAELVKRFQSKTREIELSHNRSLSHDAAAASVMQSKHKLTLTRPKEPELETACRARPMKMKSTVELEEEMLANMPKFKARPLNKKILEAPSLAAPPRSTPHLPEFQEFHLKTMERAHQHAGTASISSSIDSSSCRDNKNDHGKVHKLTEPRTPRLETSLRSRPPKVKSSQELEQEELEKMPKFKARPFHRKIYESRGEIGVSCTAKRPLTVPQEFHFATEERMPPPKEVIDLFDKLSLNSEPFRAKKLPRITTPNPFHLHTEERGQEKGKKFAEELLWKEWEEEKARIPKALPYPYTTDYPVIPPKPEPKECTKPEPFQLESLVRHEEEMQRKMLEIERMEREEAEMRMFRAQPIIKDDPLPVLEKIRMPLTQVQEFALQVDHRAVHREEFDKKIREKEMMYKRLREEYESAKMVEEEKAVKQMRRTMVPHARPLPKFDNPFLPQKSWKETTKAKSPNLRVDRRYERRQTVAASTAAAQMR